MTARSSERQPAEDTEMEGSEAGPETGLFVYGIVPSDQDVPDLAGLDGAPLTAVRCERVAALVSPVTLSRPPGRRADLVAYSDVLETVSASQLVAPVQFGSVLPDEVAVVEDLLAPQEEHLHRILEFLRGRRQFNLRVTYVEDVALQEIVEADPEVRELRELTRGLPEDAAYGERVRLGELVARSLEARGAEDADTVMDVVLPLVAADAPRGRGGPESILDVALLVDDENIATLETRLEELAEVVHERMRLRLVGPLAPFDFVGSF
jgi:hypothetical protein